MFPLAVHAQNATLASLTSVMVSYLNSILVLIMAIAIVAFVWYIIQYYIKPNEDRKQAGQYVMWALVGFFVIFSMWGLVNVLAGTFDIGLNGQSSSNSTSGLLTGNGSNSTGNSGSNMFNQNGTGANDVSSAQNNQSGVNSGASTNNPFNPGQLGVNNSLGNNGVVGQTASGSAASTGPCSKYFNVCIGASGVAWTVLSDTNEDYDLVDQKDGITIAMIYSPTLSFKGTGQPFTTVSLFGQSLPAYKKTANGVTMVIAGAQGNGATLIVTVFSNNDISVAQASSFFRGLKIHK